MVCILELKTTQSVHIKTLIDSLNPLLTDINIHFYIFTIDKLKKYFNIF